MSGLKTEAMYVCLGGYLQTRTYVTVHVFPTLTHAHEVLGLSDIVTASTNQRKMHNTP